MRIDKAEAQGVCSQVCPGKFQDCLIRRDFEAGVTEIPGCIKENLQRPPESQKGSLAKPMSAVQKGSLFESELPKNLQKKSTSEKRKGSHSIMRSEPKVSRNGSFSGAQTRELPRLTKTQKEILRLLTEEYLTTKQIAIRRNCSTSIIHRYERSLRKKGLLNRANQTVHEFGGTCEPSAKPDPKQPHAEGGAVNERMIRLHAQEFNAGILYRDERYKKKVGQVISIDGNTVRCYRDSVEVYSGQSFFADEVQKATAKSFEYWNRFFVRLENDLKIILVKPRVQNIKIVNQHYAEVGNELAVDCEMKGDKIRVYTTEDGKLWFTIDNSFNFREAETQHPQTAKEDMQNTVAPFFNDLRDKKPPKLSEIMDVIDKTVLVNQETASGLNAVVTFLKSQLPEKPDQAPKEKSKTSDLGGIYG